MALDTGVTLNSQPVQLPNPLTAYETVQRLKLGQLQQQDVQQQIAERQAQVQQQNQKNQQSTAGAQYIANTVKQWHDQGLQGDDITTRLTSPEFEAGLRGVAGQMADPLIDSIHKVAGERATLKKTQGETQASAFDLMQKQLAEKRMQASLTAQGLPDTTENRMKIQNAENPEAIKNLAEARKSNADALVAEMKAGNFPQTLESAKARLDAIAPPTDPTFKSTNARFTALLKAQQYNPQFGSDTLQQAASEAEKSATAKNTVPFKIEVQNAGASQATGAGLDLMAEQALNGNFNSRNPALFGKVYARAAEMAKERGLNSTAVIMAQNAAKANRQALDTITTQMSQMEAFSQTAARNMDILTKALNNVSDLGAPILNAPVRTLQQRLGDPRVSALVASIQPVQSEIAKILSSNTGNGVLTDNARKEMQAAISPDATPQQLKAALDVFRQDIANRREVYKAQQQDLIQGSAVQGNQGGQPKPTHRFNPATGQIEPIPQ